MAETIKYMGETSLSAYDEKIKALIATKAASSHTHSIAEVTNLQSSLDELNTKVTQKIQFITWEDDD